MDKAEWLKKAALHYADDAAQWQARAEAAEAENAKLHEVLGQFCERSAAEHWYADYRRAVESNATKAACEVTCATT